ncbi:MAG: DUF2130 domain-containing protein [Alphaproteobacteria bacterium]|nr:DUF2130 domain-containing protein [Alphaproteobacteria bacterium]MDA8029580.1 DUF2130 domain-containing protein [Alphaproteobacteria bacterium]
MDDKCPLCGKPLSTDEYEKVRKTMEEKMKQGMKEELETRIAEQEMAHEKALETARSEMAIQARRDVVAAKEEAKAEAVEEVRREAAAKELERDAAMEKAIAEQVKSQVKEITEEAGKTSRLLKDLEYEKLKLEKERDIRERQFEDYKKKQEGRSSILRGQVGEGTLYEILQKKFPDDDFVKEKPGQETADIIQRIRHNGAYIDTPICYDNKDDKQVSTQDTKKAKKYTTIHGTQHVIIVSRAMPAGSNQGITTKDGVLLVHPYIITDVVSVIRDGIIRIAEAAANAEDRDGKEADLYRYVTGDEFRAGVDRLFSLRDEMASLQSRERKEHETIWKKRDEMIEVMSAQLLDVRDHITKITQGVLQKIRQG